jgi:DNA polymerase (family 10)
MTVHNSEIATIFTKLADLLEIEGANPFRIRAYRNAARVINGLAKNISDLVDQEFDLTELPGIGKDLAEKLIVIVKTGELPLLKEVESRIPAVLSELLKIEGLGPKRVQILYKKLGVQSLQELKEAIEQGKLRELEGFGKKTEEKISAGIEHVKAYTQRILLVDAASIVNSIMTYLKKLKSIKKIQVAGSYRRCNVTVGDLDILVSAKNGEQVIQHFVSFDEVMEVVSKGSTRSTVRLHSGIQVDLRVVEEGSYGAALIYFTGSKAHNIAIRKIAMDKKLKINEYGVFKGEQQVAGKTEKDVYKSIGLVYVEPEMRENRGEIELAQKNALPHLITVKKIRGDLHCHTHATDGKASIEEIAEKAVVLGYEYIAITDHSKHLTVAHGLTKK